MTAIPRLRLGTAAQTAPAPPASTARHPGQLRPGAAVWVYFRGWRSGVLQRVIVRNPRLANHGKARGDVAVVALDDARASNLTVRRPVAEVILAFDDRPISEGRESAQQFAREWWIEQERSLALSL